MGGEDLENLILEAHGMTQSESMRPTGYGPEHLTATGSLKSSFVVKTGGPQTVGAGGMVRSSADHKTDYSLALDGPMFSRWAEHLSKATRPPTSYPKRNWMKAKDGTEDERRAVLERARESAVRHFIQWWRGDSDEDHGAALFFNVNLAELIKETL